jgi:hypothetical protein
MADLTQTAANVKLQGQSGVSVGQAGEALTQGQPIYLLAGKWYRCDANDTAAKANCAAIALTPASSNGYFVYALPGALIDVGATLAVGTLYSVSTTLGAIAPVSDLASTNYVTTLGIATAATTLAFNPQVSGIQKA